MTLVYDGLQDVVKIAHTNTSTLASLPAPLLPPFYLASRSTFDIRHSAFTILKRVDRRKQQPETMSNDNQDGPIDRLAKSLFASPGSPFTAFADKQRSERLEQCKDLEDILMACQRANNKVAVDDSGAAATDRNESVENTSRSEARIKRFFKWNEPHQSNDDKSSVLQDAAASILDGDGDIRDKNDNNQSRKLYNNSTIYSKGCIRETHEMWACRALALGCGNHLSDLRRCWSDASSVQSKGELTFNDGDGGSDASCSGIQQQMARCVLKNTAELKERMAAAKK